MKYLTGLAICLLITGFVFSLASAGTLGYIEVEKVFSSYEKTKKAQDQIRKKEQILQDEISMKQKQIENAKNKGASDSELKNMIAKFEKELESKREDIIASQQKITQEIHNDIVKATESAAKEQSVEIVLDKQVFITGGVDLTDKVIEKLHKK
jgi:Skp family chaperone for outer membrane proteins